MHLVAWNVQSIVEETGSLGKRKVLGAIQAIVVIQAGASTECRSRELHAPAARTNEIGTVGYSPRRLRGGEGRAPAVYSVARGDART